MNTNNGTFIAFEGIDGSGKSTQISLLKQHIEEHAINCIVTREPSDGPIGTLLRQFLTGRIRGDEATIAALFAADRLDHLNNPVNGIKRLLEDGLAVLTDRYLFSNYAYQSVTLPLEWIMKCNAMASDTLKPQCHIFIDVEPDAAIQRMAAGRHQTELFETKERLTDVRERYLDLFERLGSEENILIINGNRPVEEISREIWSKVCHYFV
jgi:dTMP kinase